MRFLLLLTASSVELAATMAKWLFIATAPVLLIVTASYFQTGNSYVEPLVGLALVSGIFVATRSLSKRLQNTQPVDRENDLVLPEMEAGPIVSAAGTWNPYLEKENRKQVAATEETRRANQRQTELWKQANPWGGYNPFE